MAVEEINEAGGLKIGDDRYKIKLLIEDHGAKPGASVGIVEKYIEKDKVKIVFGDLVSSSVLAWAPVVERYNGKVMAFVSGASAGTIAKNHPHVINSKPPIDQYFAGGRFLAKNLGGKKMVVMIQSDDYGQILAKGLKKEFTDHGGKVVKEEFFKLGDRDFYTQLTSVKKEDFDVLYSSGYADESYFIFKQAKELGIKAIMAATIGSSEEDTLKKFKPADLEGVYDLGTPAEIMILSGRKIAVEKDKKYKSKYGKTMASLAIMGYDGMKILAKGLERAGTVDDVPKILKTLKEMKIDEIKNDTIFIRIAAPGTGGLIFGEAKQGYIQTGAAKWLKGKMIFVDWVM